MVMRYVCLYLLLVSSIYSQEIFTRVCDKRVFNDEKCHSQVPYCKRFTASVEGLPHVEYTFKCDECEEGFEPENKTFKSKSDELRLPRKVLTLCKRVATTSPLATIPVLHELPNCNIYQVSELDTTSQTARFTCLECKEEFYFTPEQGGVVASTDVNVIKHVCTRNIGIYECGEVCQREFPGCLKFEIISRRKNPNVQTSTEWLARIHCLEAKINYEVKQAIEDYPIDNKDNVVDLVIPQYQSSVIECTSPLCKVIFPKCEMFAWLSTDPTKSLYSCSKCSPGYYPVDHLVESKSFVDLQAYGTSVYLCEIEAVENRRVVEKEWKEEFPGCEFVSISNPVRDESFFGDLVATYICNECEDGYEPIRNNRVYRVFDRHVSKYLCRPIEAQESSPKECKTNDSCKIKLKGCNYYASKYIDDSNRDSPLVSYKCVECSYGFTSTKNWTDPIFFDEVEVLDVCEHIETPGPVPCTDTCQDLFPKCDSVSIKKDKFNDDIYQCHECSEGYYPIDFEDGVKGRISNIHNVLRNQTEVHLCDQNPNHVHISKIDMRLHLNNPPSISLYFGALSQCKLVTYFMDLKSRAMGMKCLLCNEGYIPEISSWEVSYFGHWDLCKPDLKPDSESPSESVKIAKKSNSLNSLRQ